MPFSKLQNDTKYAYAPITSLVWAEGRGCSGGWVLRISLPHFIIRFLLYLT